jgi:hypothetical protein
MSGKINETERELMRHALGLNREREAFRNHFVCGEGHSDYDAWEALAARGLARKRRNSLNEMCVEFIFHLTDEGRAALQ